mmetsp:Transcript_11442/g.32934  ORF Transcript_11442/g.32934 Transcript_11442/m.32934 type:complete len:206 (-) Transcript_11442:65-682(-)
MVQPVSINARCQMAVDKKSESSVEVTEIIIHCIEQHTIATRSTYGETTGTMMSSTTIDPKLSPATAAVERLNLLPEREWNRVRLLSERDDDYYGAIDQIDNHAIQQTEYKEGIDGVFDMTALSQISKSICTEHRTSLKASPIALLYSTCDMEALFSIATTKKGRSAIAKGRRRRLVRCIAWKSRLALLDASPSNVTSHKRVCSAR